MKIIITKNEFETFVSKCNEAAEVIKQSYPKASAPEIKLEPHARKSYVASIDDEGNYIIDINSEFIKDAISIGFEWVADSMPLIEGVKSTFIFLKAGIKKMAEKATEQMKKYVDAKEYAVITFENDILKYSGVAIIKRTAGDTCWKKNSDVHTFVSYKTAFSDLDYDVRRSIISKSINAAIDDVNYGRPVAVIDLDVAEKYAEELHGELQEGWINSLSEDDE